jgi:hypothetical protein
MRRAERGRIAVSIPSSSGLTSNKLIAALFERGNGVSIPSSSGLTSNVMVGYQSGLLSQSLLLQVSLLMPTDRLCIVYCYFGAVSQSLLLQVSLLIGAPSTAGPQSLLLQVSLRSVVSIPSSSGLTSNAGMPPMGYLAVVSIPSSSGLTSNASPGELARAWSQSLLLQVSLLMDGEFGSKDGAASQSLLLQVSLLIAVSDSVRLRLNPFFFRSHF